VKTLMSTTTHDTPTVPPALEIAGPVTCVPSLEELELLTAIPERRVVYRGVDWAFYDRLMDSIPEGSNIHVDFDGRDLEVMGNGPDHEWIAESLGQFVKAVAGAAGIPCRGMGLTTWKRIKVARGLESDRCFYFQPEKRAAAARAFGANDLSGYPNPDLAIEVDLSRPAVDRANIYAALNVPEVWRFSAKQVFIERLTPGGVYIAVDTSLFLPVRADDIRRWIVDEDLSDEIAWTERLQAAIRARKANT
jgi:Uma2 family endonuclease